MLSSLRVDFVGEQIQLLQLGVVLDGVLELLKQVVVHVARVKRQRFQVSLVFKRFQERAAYVLELFQIVVREKEVG